MSEQGVFVYVIVDTDRQFAKVGIAKNVARRRRQLQVSYPTTLTVAHAVHFPKLIIGAQVEYRTHRILADVRLNGEWFNADAATCAAAIEQAKRWVRNRRGNLAWQPDVKRLINLGSAAR